MNRKQQPPSAQERIANALEAIVADARRREHRTRVESRAEAELRRLRRSGAHDVEPHRLNVGTFAKAIPGYVELWAKIPPEFWSIDGDHATVACPCGASPEIEFGVPTFCGSWGCPRAYVFDGQHIRVAFSPKRVSQVSDVSPA